MTFDAPTVEEIAAATEQDFQQVARDFYATAQAVEGSPEADEEASSADG